MQCYLSYLPLFRRQIVPKVSNHGHKKTQYSALSHLILHDSSCLPFEPFVNVKLLYRGAAGCRLCGKLVCNEGITSSICRLDRLEQQMQLRHSHRDGRGSCGREEANLDLCISPICISFVPVAQLGQDNTAYFTFSPHRILANIDERRLVG